VHGTEVAIAAQPQPDSDDCGCSTECACRGPDKGCGCYSPGLTMEARCGCGGSGPQHEGMAPSWDTEFAPACAMGAPLLMWSPAPDPGDLLWQAGELVSWPDWWAFRQACRPTFLPSFVRALRAPRALPVWAQAAPRRRR